MTLVEELESPRKRLFHRITGWLVLVSGTCASYLALVFLATR